MDLAKAQDDQPQPLHSIKNMENDLTIVLSVQHDSTLKQNLSWFMITNQFRVWQGAQEMKVITLVKAWT